MATAARTWTHLKGLARKKEVKGESAKLPYGAKMRRCLCMLGFVYLRLDIQPCPKSLCLFC